MLKCKACSFEHETDLVNHIETAHADLTLDAYFEKYSCDVGDVVREEAPVSTTKGGSVSTGVKIRDIELPKGSGGEFVPKVNAAYHFGKNAEDVCRDILEQRKIMLIGHTGCGKTSMVDQIAARCGQGALRANMNGQTTIGDFVGMWTVKGGETVWVDGVLPKAMREGLWLIIDELDFAEPAILSVLNSVLEQNGKLMLKEKGHEIVAPHADFRLFATANAVGCMSNFRGLYQGTNLMNEAFLDRWRVYHIDYLSADEEAKVIAATVPRMNVKIAAVIVKVAGMVRAAFEKEEISCTFSLRRMIDWAELMVRHRDPMKAAEASIFSKVSREDAEIIKGLITRVMVGNKPS
jgi:cobaltochelatase CobS